MSAAVDVAVFDLLRDDAVLSALVPGGIFRDAAPESVTEAGKDLTSEVFGIISVRRDMAHHTFCGSAFEEIAYLVQFAAPSSNPSGAQAAIERAEELLPALAVPEYHVACSRPRERLPFVVVDGPVRWETRAVLWEVWAHP
jgi:hypothetical protein